MCRRERKVNGVVGLDRLESLKETSVIHGVNCPSETGALKKELRALAIKGHYE